MEDCTRFTKELIRQAAEFGTDFMIGRGAPVGALAYLVWQKTKLPFYVESFEPHADYMREQGRIVTCYNPDYQVLAGTIICRVDRVYFRPTEVELLIGDPTKCKAKLSWEPKYDLPTLVQDMVQAEVELFKRDTYLPKGGYKVNYQHEQQ